MKTIIEEYGQVVLVAIAIVALVTIVSTLVQSGGAMSASFNGIMTSFDTAIDGALDGMDTDTSQ